MKEFVRKNMRNGMEKTCTFLFPVEIEGKKATPGLCCVVFNDYSGVCPLVCVNFLYKRNCTTHQHTFPLLFSLLFVACYAF